MSVFHVSKIYLDFAQFQVSFYLSNNCETFKDNLSNLIFDNFQMSYF